GLVAELGEEHRRERRREQPPVHPSPPGAPVNAPAVDGDGRLLRGRLEDLALDALRGVGVDVVAVARRLLLAAADRAAGLARELVDGFGRQHAPLLEERALLGGQRRRPRGAPALEAVGLARREARDLL